MHCGIIQVRCSLKLGLSVLGVHTLTRQPHQCYTPTMLLQVAAMRNLSMSDVVSLIIHDKSCVILPMSSILPLKVGG